MEHALIATRAFLRWAAREQRLGIELALDSKEVPDSPGLLAALGELKNIMGAHRVKKRGTAVGDTYIERCASELRAFGRWLSEREPQTDFRSASQITAEHLTAYQSALQVEGPLGKALAPKTVYNRVDSLVAVIRAALKQKRPGFSVKNIEGLELDGFEDVGQADRCLARKGIAKMYALDMKAAGLLPLEQ